MHRASLGRIVLRACRQAVPASRAVAAQANATVNRIAIAKSCGRFSSGGRQARDFPGIEPDLFAMAARTQASAGQRQSVAIARSLLGDPKLVILDEPTAALGVAQTRQVLDLLARLRERGLGVIVISHNITDVFEVSDRIIVLRLGRRVATFKTSETTPDAVVGAITTGART